MIAYLTDINGEKRPTKVLFTATGVFVKELDEERYFNGADEDGWLHFNRLGVENRKEVIKQSWQQLKDRQKLVKG